MVVDAPILARHRPTPERIAHEGEGDDLRHDLSIGGSRETRGKGAGHGSGPVERAPEIGDEVVDALDPDRQPNERRIHLER
jgi:hypothetical protein